MKEAVRREPGRAQLRRNRRGRSSGPLTYTLAVAAVFLASCGTGGSAANSSATATSGRSVTTSTATPGQASAAALAFSRVNWSQITLPGQNAIPDPPLQKGACAMETLGQILKTSEAKYVIYLSPVHGQDFAVVAGACSYYNLNAVTLFVFRAGGSAPPTLVEVAYDGWFSNPDDLTTRVPVASVLTGGVKGYFQYRSMRVVSDGKGFVVSGVTFGPNGPATPVSSSKMVPAEMVFSWNGTYYVFSSAKNVEAPTARL